MSNQMISPYSVEYKEIVFAIWYKNQRPNPSKLFSFIPDDESGRKPHATLLAKWMIDGDWVIRADELDAGVSSSIDKELIKERIQTFERHAKIGQELQDKGLEYIRENGFKSGADALRAVISGAELEKNSLGLSVALSKIFELNNEQVTGEIAKLLNKASSEDVVDGEVLEEDGE